LEILGNRIAAWHPSMLMH